MIGARPIADQPKKARSSAGPTRRSQVAAVRPQAMRARTSAIVLSIWTRIRFRWAALERIPVESRQAGHRVLLVAWGPNRPPTSPAGKPKLRTTRPTESCADSLGRLLASND
jgi:hypothetical protein